MKVLCIEIPYSIIGYKNMFVDKHTKKYIKKGEWYEVNGYNDEQYVIKTKFVYTSINKRFFLTKQEFRKLKLQKLKTY